MTRTQLFVPAPALDVEMVISDSGERAVFVASDPAAGGARRLVTRVPSEDGTVAPPFHEARAPWDLPLVEVRRENAASVLVIESLPVGVPSTTLAPSLRLPPCAASLARQVADAHAAGALAGPLHPALVFVDADGQLVATAQRSVRVRPGMQDAAVPLFATVFWTPAEALGLPPTAPDDVFRLASMAWRWRHGRPPFGSGPAEVIAVARGVPGAPPDDALDELLVRSFAPDPTARPTILGLLAAFEAS